MSKQTIVTITPKGVFIDQRFRRGFKEDFPTDISNEAADILAFLTNDGQNGSYVIKDLGYELKQPNITRHVQELLDKQLVIVR